MNKPTKKDALLKKLRIQLATALDKGQSKRVAQIADKITTVQNAPAGADFPLGNA